MGFLGTHLPRLVTFPLFRLDLRSCCYFPVGPTTTPSGLVLSACDRERKGLFH
nr:hypothetical protein Q903MT_gene1372 [Picea sitchensis]